MLEDRAAPSGGLLEILMAAPLIQLQLGEYRERSIGRTAEDLAAALLAKRSAPPTRERLQTLSLAFEGAMGSALRVARIVREGNVDEAYQELATARDKVEELADQVTQIGGTFGKFDLRSLAQTLDWVDDLVAEAAARAAKSSLTDATATAGGSSAAPAPAMTGATDATSPAPASSADQDSSTSALPSGGSGGSSISTPINANQNTAVPADLQSPTSEASGGGGGMALLSGGNQAPVAENDSLTASQYIPTTVNVVENDSDPDGNHFFITSAGPAEHGEVTFTGNTVTYKPELTYHGPDSFTYTITDGHFDDQGQLGTATATVTVIAVDDNPTARPDYEMTSQSSPVLINVAANDFDPEGDFDVVDVTPYTWMGARITNNFDGTVTYDPGQTNGKQTGQNNFPLPILPENSPDPFSAQGIGLPDQPPVAVVGVPGHVVGRIGHILHVAHRVERHKRACPPYSSQRKDSTGRYSLFKL